MLALLLSSLLLPTEARAWGHHYLLTDRALAHEDLAWTQAEVEVESIDRLLARAAPALSRAIDAHYAWLAQQGEERYRRQVLDLDAPDRAAFLRAARLRPDVPLPLVVRTLPGGDPVGFAVAPEAASRYLHETGPLLARVTVVQEGSRIPARAVLATYSDEPDWGFDHELWGFTEYGYGAQPFGKAQGESSKAPFHMQFDHENLLTRAVTDLDEGMVPVRIDLFLRLARAAFAEGHDYWGLRFSAWAMHYAQDLAQPYHSRAVPSARLSWYLGYLLSGDKARIEAETTQLSANRHFVYEDVVAFDLQQSFLEEDSSGVRLARLLVEGPSVLELRGEALGADASALELVAALTGPAARHAYEIDQALRASFPAGMMEDPAYDVETAPDYAIATVLDQVPAAARQALLDQTGADFHQAGAATRTVLRLTGAETALAAEQR